MLVYLDSSALMKLYIQEAGSETVTVLLDEAGTAGTSVVALAEVTSALGRLARGGLISASAAAGLRETFQRDWQDLLRFPVDEGTASLAATVAWEEGVRGFDAVHLAAALRWADEAGMPITFASFDARQARAARARGLATIYVA